MIKTKVRNIKRDCWGHELKITTAAGVHIGLLADSKTEKAILFEAGIPPAMMNLDYFLVILKEKDLKATFIKFDDIKTIDLIK